MRRNGMKRFISLALTAGLCLSQTLSAMAAGGANASPAVRLFRQAAKSASEIADPVTDKDYVTTWDCIEFGHYWQDANDSGLFNWDKDPVKWRVLDVGEDGVALLLSDKALGVCNYYDEDGGQKPETITWENSTLRSFLNSSNASENLKKGKEDGFLKCAFNEDEIVKVKSVNINRRAGK